METSDPVKQKTLTTKLRENPFIFATIVLGIIAIFLLIVMMWDGITRQSISEEEAITSVEEFLNAQIDGVEVLSIQRDSSLYVLTFNSSSYGESFVYITLDGKYIINGLMPLEGESIEPSQPISECIEPYGLSPDTIIFYYSDQCGWCAKMKPGVEVLEEEGYNFHWVEGSDTDASEIIEKCIQGYMTSGGVPQFICPKTEEIYVGAFVDEESNLDQSAMRDWVDECISD